jgi:hypothetical protein
MRLVIAGVLSIAVVTTASAQSTYVGGSFFGEFAQYGGIDIDDDFTRIASSYDVPSRSGESVGFDIRVGRAFTPRWGIEFAIGRGGSIENTAARQIPGSQLPVVPILPGLPTLPIQPVPFEYELTTTAQHTTLDTVAWVQQDLGTRAHLVILGGASFTRIEDGQGLRITDQRLATFVPFPLETESTRYGVGPVVGAEAVFDLGAHAAITAGARLHGGTGGWLIRPSGGLRWSF